MQIETSVMDKKIVSLVKLLCITFSKVSNLVRYFIRHSPSKRTFPRFCERDTATLNAVSVVAECSILQHGSEATKWGQLQNETQRVETHTQ